MQHAIALYDCVADEAGELSFTEGTRFVDVVESPEFGWLEGTIELTAERGLFPANHVRLVTPSSPKLAPVASLPTSTSISSSWSMISQDKPAPLAPVQPDNRAASPPASPPPASSNSSLLHNHRAQLKSVGGSFTASSSIATQSAPNGSISTSTDTKLSDAFVLPALRPVLLKETSNATGPSTIGTDNARAPPSSGQLSRSMSPAMPATSPRRAVPLEETEDEDGYQLVKPSQIRKQQQQGKEQNAPNLPNASNTSHPPVIKPKPAGLQARAQRSMSNPSPQNNPEKRVAPAPPPSRDPKPAIHKKTSIPVLPSRPSPSASPRAMSPAAPTTPTTASSTSQDHPSPAAIWQQKNQDDDTIVKPSQLRLRSATNPSSTLAVPFAQTNHTNTSNSAPSSSNSSTSSLVTSPGSSSTNATRSPAIRAPPPPPPASLAPAASSTASSTSSPASSVASRKHAPPPPPPSRKTRYDDLFDAIQDHGVVDGATVSLIWTRSKLPNHTLASIWQQCDQQGTGLLDRQRFIDGMVEIDSQLLKYHKSSK
ncbi:hypothetical protein BC940DRAFT_363520 [Gongronella butleri]|nr:hypothetical protein BC940DRAFT_363520 [Gongronella butleri]